MKNSLRVLDTSGVWKPLGRLVLSQPHNYLVLCLDSVCVQFIITQHSMMLLNAFISIGRDVTHVDVELVPCTKVSVDIFDPVFSSGIVRTSGHIAKCFHEVHPDFDELRVVSMQYLNHFRSHDVCLTLLQTKATVY